MAKVIMILLKLKAGHGLFDLLSTKLFRRNIEWKREKVVEGYGKIPKSYRADKQYIADFDNWLALH